jgi:hypothetical protein
VECALGNVEALSRATVYGVLLSRSTTVCLAGMDPTDVLQHAWTDGRVGGWMGWSLSVLWCNLFVVTSTLRSDDSVFTAGVVMGAFEAAQPAWSFLV